MRPLAKSLWTIVYLLHYTAKQRRTRVESGLFTVQHTVSKPWRAAYVDLHSVYTRWFRSAWSATQASVEKKTRKTDNTTGLCNMAQALPDSCYS